MPHHRKTEEVTMRIIRSIHRWALAGAFACLVLATVATSAPAATRDQIPSAEARALAQERYYESYGEPVQDLRSPDARDAGRPVTTTPAPVATAAPVAGSRGGDGIAALPFVLSLAGAVIVGVGLSTAVHARRRVAA
jgi:hypothetical protein